MGDLADVKVGDNLFIKTAHSMGHIVAVDRITPSGRVITKSGEFNPNGRKRGDRGSWSSVWARLATEDDVAGIYRLGLVRKLESFRKWDKLSADDLKAASEIIAKYKLPLSE